MMFELNNEIIIDLQVRVNRLLDHMYQKDKSLYYELMRLLEYIETKQADGEAIYIDELFDEFPGCIDTLENILGNYV